MAVHEPGSRIGGQYQVAGDDAGGMGVAYPSTDTHTGRPVALKTWEISGVS